MTRIGIIISLALFTLGNATYMVLHNEPKLVWIPLATAIAFLVFEVKKFIPETEKLASIFLTYFFILALGNILKQVFYTEEIKQINDYIFGGLVTLWLIFRLVIYKNKKWAIRKTQRDGRSGLRG